MDEIEPKGVKQDGDLIKMRGGILRRFTGGFISFHSLKSFLNKTEEGWL
jgi:hypothetical protein